MNTPASPALQRGVQAASPFAIVTGAYLLFAGHNQPGGGFAAGLVFGAVIALRVLSGLQRPTRAVPLLNVGVLIVCAVAILPLAWGDVLLDQQVGSITLPVLGKIKSGTALVFDVGVAAIVMGLVVALLDGLDAERFASDPTLERSPSGGRP